MNCTPNFTEWSREEKEEFAKRRMDEMRLKNERLLQRHAEVENDRIKAESRNSAVTGAAKAVRKEKSVVTVEGNKEEIRPEHAREWDRGKPDKDHWKSPEHHGSSFKNYRSSGRFDRKDGDRKDNWGSFSRNENTDRSRPNRGTDGRQDNYNDDGWGQTPNKLPYNKSYKTHTLDGRQDNHNDDGWGQTPNKLPYNKAYKTHPLEGCQDNHNDDGWGQTPNKLPYNKSYKTHPLEGRQDNHNDGWDQTHNTLHYNKSYKTHSLEEPYEKRKDTWSGYPRNESTDHFRYDHASDGRKLRGNYRYKQNDNNQHSSSRLQMSPKRTRGVGYRNNDTHRKSQSSYSDDKYKRPDYNRSNSRKKYSYRAHSRSTSRSGSDYVENQYTIRAYNLWQNDKISEDQTKQNRVEKWVKSVNKTNMWGGKQFTPEQKDKSNSKFTPEQKDKNTSTKVSSEQKDKNTNRSYSKFDRFEQSPNKSSDDEGLDARGSKSCENSYSGNKNRNVGALYNLGHLKQIDGLKKKGVQTKRSPQYSSGSSGKNGNFRKQRRFDGKGQKNDEDRNRFKPKRPENTWKNQPLDNKASYTKENTDTWNQEEDGIWGNADQSNIKWKISDEETETKEQDKKPTKKNINTSDSWNDSQIATDPKKGRLKEQFQVKDKNENKHIQDCDDDGIWSNVDQTDVHWKSDTEAFSEGCKNQNLELSNSENIQKAAKTDSGDGWEDIKESAEGKDEQCNTSGQMTYDSGANEASITSSPPRLQKHCDLQAHSEAEMMIRSFKRSVCISNEKSINVSIDHFSEKPVPSDDGGWSTVSEEGEIKSDHGDENKNRKFSKRKHCD